MSQKKTSFKNLPRDGSHMVYHMAATQNCHITTMKKLSYGRYLPLIIAIWLPYDSLLPCNVVRVKTVLKQCQNFMKRLKKPVIPKVSGLSEKFKNLTVLVKTLIFTILPQKIQVLEKF